jgi:hypothetical protein
MLNARLQVSGVYACQKRLSQLLSPVRISLGGMQLSPTHAPPRRVGVERCTHAAWVRPVDAAGIGRPKHLTLCLPFKQLQCLASFRVGWHHLKVHSGRLKHPTIPRADRLCKLCSVGAGRFYGQESGPHVEDLMRFMLECPAYDDIRSRFPRTTVWFCCGGRPLTAIAVHLLR